MNVFRAYTGSVYNMCNICSGGVVDRVVSLAVFLLFLAVLWYMFRCVDLECWVREYCDMDEKDLKILCVNVKPKYTNPDNVSGY